jgi:hypothetical protein
VCAFPYMVEMSTEEPMVKCRFCGATYIEDQLTREKEFEHLICEHFNLVMSLAESLWERVEESGFRKNIAQMITK